MEQIYNCQALSGEQRARVLGALPDFFPLHQAKALQSAMSQSAGEQMPQFYVVLREGELMGYLFLIGDTRRFPALPWLAVDNLNELPMRVVEPLSAIAIEAWSNEEDNSIAANAWVAQHYWQRLENYRLGIGRRPGEASR